MSIFSSSPVTLLALLFYLGVSLWQSLALVKGQQVNKKILLLLSLLAIFLHGLNVIPLVNTSAGINLGFFQVSSLIFWVMCLVLLISALRLPVENLFPVLFCLAAISILCSACFHSDFTPQIISPAIGWHVLLSILAYSILTIAAIQALALAAQDKLLREKKFQGLLNTLPALQSMEALLFEMLWAGTALLTFALVTGWLFFDDAMEQQLVHKMFFSSIAWVVYAILLWGRGVQGWRGQQAIRWTLGGFTALMLAYFGSKLVLELVIQTSI